MEQRVLLEDTQTSGTNENRAFPGEKMIANMDDVNPFERHQSKNLLCSLVEPFVR